jgi:hypothetical protein
MATTTPNFGWVVPTSSDLVKNGAVAIETLGDSIDASMVDLKGGTTGQVLSKTSATDMDFTWTTPSGGSNSFYAGKNKFINADFSLNQRAFTSTTTTGTYGFDRWKTLTSGGTSTYSSQTFTLGAAPVAGYEGKNYARIVTSGQSAAGDYSTFDQLIESVRTFAGQTVTVSFWAKAATGTPKIAVSASQNFGTGGSPSAVVITYGGQATLSTSWARYSITMAIPSISGKTIGTTANTDSVEMLFWVSAGSSSNAYTGSMGIQNNTFDFWGAQIEAGSTMTDFVTASGNSPQAELAMCQRYYQQNTAGVYWNGFATNTVNFYTMVYFPVAMRTAPTITNTSTVAGNFPATASSASSIGTTSFVNARIASGTGAGGYADTYTASAEL